MLGLILFIMCLYSLVIGSILYIFVGFLHKPIDGGWKKNRQVVYVCGFIIFNYIYPPITWCPNNKISGGLSNR